MNGADITPRKIAGRLVEALADTRIVVLQGARQVGKSTLVEQVAAEHGGHVVTLDDPESLAFAKADPTGFVAQRPDSLLVIDELQRAPELVIALKAAVDRDKRPGRFLVTGSANLVELAATHESLAGRAETLTLHSFSQSEIDVTPGTFADSILGGRRPLDHVGGLTRAQYLARACAGGYPEALARVSDQRRTTWYGAYVDQIVNRDAADISGLQRIADLPRLLRFIAARSGSGMVWTALANDSGIPRRTLDPYVRLLETLYLIHVLPAWAVNLTSREVKQPKVFALDTGLAAALLGVTIDGLGPVSGAGMAGGLLEAFVVGELRRQIGWSTTPVTMHHFRDSRGSEVDVVLEARDGRVMCVEVKAAATVQPRDLTGLTTLRDRLGDRFVAGVVLHTGDRSQAVGDRLMALPVDALWRL